MKRTMDRQGSTEDMAMSEWSLTRSLVRKQDGYESKPEVGLLRQVLASSQQMMLVRHEMQSGWVGARHSHPQEQLVYVIRGRLKFTRGTEVFEIGAGDSVIVAPNLEHEAAALEDAEVLDIFAPYRDDYWPRKSDV